MLIILPAYTARWSTNTVCPQHFIRIKLLYDFFLFLCSHSPTNEVGALKWIIVEISLLLLIGINCWMMQICLFQRLELWSSSHCRWCFKRKCENEFRQYFQISLKFFVWLKKNWHLQLWGWYQIANNENCKEHLHTARHRPGYFSDHKKVEQLKQSTQGQLLSSILR